MPKSRPRKSSGRTGTTPLLLKPDRIDELLKIQQETFPQKELSAEEINRWHQDLEPYQMDAIEWAFDNWRRNGHFFPVPGDIIDQCDAWTPAIEQGLCSPECRSRHGKGLNENDVLWLWKTYSQKFNEIGRDLTQQEKDELLTGLYEFRGGPPGYAL